MFINHPKRWQRLRPWKPVNQTAKVLFPTSSVMSQRHGKDESVCFKCMRKTTVELRDLYAPFF